MTGLTRWGLGRLASPKPPFWPIAAMYVAATGQKTRFSEGVPPSRPSRLADDQVTCINGKVTR